MDNPYKPELHSVTAEIGGRQLTIEHGRFAFQATGSATITLGDTVILGNATLAKTPRAGCDFFPLTVDYEEKHYAAGKIKGSRFVKRDGRPSENAILRCRMIDRPIRPLFPKGMTNDVQIITTVLSADLEVDPGISAITAASAALLMAGAPIAAPVAGIKIGYVDEKFVVNPTYEQEKEGRLNLTVAGTMEAITMVEAGAKELPEEIMLEALTIAHGEIKKICQMQLDLVAQVNPTKWDHVLLREKNESAAGIVADFFTKDDLDTVAGKLKQDVKTPISVLEERLFEAQAAAIEAEEISKGDLAGALQDALDKNMRQNILDKDTRLDGRGLDEVRQLETAVAVLPRTHGTGLFQRGETQVLSVATLGSPGKSQIIDTMDVDEVRRYMHHYNFPPYSTGEAKMLRGTSRREVGHGDLGERALLPVLPTMEDFPYTMLVVSEILSCNGSSSMGSVCGSTMALMDAGVPLIRPVSGIAMGLVTDKDADGKFNTYKILSDIQGLEDFAGDMDFKVTGTTEGLTALQMDIKVKGLSIDILREALEQSKRGRQHILDSMLAVIPEPRAELNKYAPMIDSVKIDPEQIGAIIGKGGETIQKITKECEVEIDVGEDGLVVITAPDQERGKKAKEWIESIVKVPEPGDEYDGKVVRIMDFGAFVEFAPGKDGMLHISALQQGRTEKVSDAVKIGEIIRIRIHEVDPMGRVNLARVLPDGTVLTPAPRR